MKRYTNILYAAMTLCLALLLPSCVDDGLGFYNGPDDGEAVMSLDITFSPFSAGNLDTRANIENGNGKTLNILDNMYILVYDNDGNIVNIGDNTYVKEVDLDTYKPVSSDTDRKDEDASNGATAEKKTLTVKNIPLKLPFGRYYIVAVANLKQKTYDAIHALDTDGKPMNCKTLDGLRRMKVDWDKSELRNNGEMMGYFTDSELSNVANDVPAANRIFGSVAVNRGGMKLHAWLRRCASKVTISFDGSKLRDNVTVYIKEARIYDIPYDCTLGFGQPTGMNESEQSYNHRVSEDGEKVNGFYHENAQKISYLPNNGNDATTEITGESDVIAQNWPHISKGMSEIRNNTSDHDYETATPVDFHAETADALYFYENMQDNPENKTKLSHADLENGGVAVSGENKDGIKYGTYIEVEGYYSSNAYGNYTHGKIKYRFMLGKNVTDNFEAERNYHYKLTLCPRGNGNDADWHIDFEEPEGFHVPNPWYVSYLYNHDAILPFSYVAPEGWTVTGLRAEIIKNPWYPTDAEIEKLSDPTLPIIPTTPFGDETGAYTNSKNQQDYNGFLSLRATDAVVVTDKMALGRSWAYGDSGDYSKESGTTINEKYYYGGKTKNASGEWVRDDKYEYTIDRSQRIYMENGGKKTYNDYPKDTPQTVKDREDFSYKKEGNTWSFDIPLFTRAKVLVKPTGYSGNNPFVGYQRIARVRLYVTREKGGEKKEESTDVNVVQVRRVVNPKGVYRRAGNNDPFHVKMMWLDGDDSDTFEPVISKGPWRAEIIGDANFITLDGKQTVSGSTDDPVSFTIRFNRMNSDKNDKRVRNAVVRIKYHNYTCTHLIFVRQGYVPQEIVPQEDCRDSDHEGYGATPIKWRTCNMIHGEKEASDPRDEGSLFKFGNATQPIDAYSNVYRIGGKEVYHNLTKSEFSNSEIYRLKLVDKNGNLTQQDVAWDKILKGEDFSGSISSVATMRDFEQLYLSRNVQFGYGVLYADGATTTQQNLKDAYGYYRGDTNTGDSHKGMRGLFAYYWDGKLSGGNKYNAKNVFFPIGRSGYGHRKNNKEGDGKEPGNGILRYSCGRGTPNEGLFSNAAPLFVAVYRRPGAIYWAKKIDSAREWNWDDKIEYEPGNNNKRGAYGLDINYFSFDVNLITATNVDNGNDACFVRCVGD